MPRIAVILPAAGASTRFGSPISKLFVKLNDRPVIATTLLAFLGHPDVEMIVIATSLGDAWDTAPPVLRKTLDDPRIRRCDGGASRAHSVRNALAQVPPYFEWVAVHDAARPLVSTALIDRTFEAAVRHGAAVPALPIVPTVKQADGPLPAKVQRTVPRQVLWGVQTPQIARREVLEKAFANCPLPFEQVTDESQLLELAGHDVWLVAGEERNIKITTPHDLLIAAAFLNDAADKDPRGPALE